MRHKVFCTMVGRAGERFPVKPSQGSVVLVIGGVEDHGGRSHALGHAAQRQYQGGRLLASFDEVHAH